MLIPAEALDLRRDPARLSPREVVAHLADWEEVFLERLRLAQSQPGASVPVYDEDARAAAKGYASADVPESLRTFREGRAETAAFLKALPPGAYDQPLDHPRYGRLRLEDLANQILGHDLYHLEQLSEYLERGL